MARHRLQWSLCLTVLASLWPNSSKAQEPTILQEAASDPGSYRSNLGPTPGAGANPFSGSPGAGGEVLGGRLGPSFPRVPLSLSTPAGGQLGAIGRQAISAPPRLRIADVPLYGALEIPTGAEDEGPADGLTLEMAIDRLIHENLDLRHRFAEIPQAEADILTASLRANPIVFADSQLNPYGSYTKRRPGGPNQYDINISHPFDVSHKRQSRTVVAIRAKRVLEAQYQDAVRLQIDNLYTAFVDVLAARETIRYARASVVGIASVLDVTQKLYARSDATRPDVFRVKILHEAAEVGVQDAQEQLRRTKRTLAALLNVPPSRAESMELRGTLADRATPPPDLAVLNGRALAARPDLNAYRLGIRRAEADVRLALASRFADAYVLYQPFTFQNNAPIGLKSSTSYALGTTVALPISNRNQGGIQRAHLNVSQTQIELAALERRIVEEVTRSVRNLEITRTVLRQVEQDLLPAARQLRADSFKLYAGGEMNVLGYLDAQREYNEVVRKYRDTTVRHRRNMLEINTVVGERILP